MPSNDFWCSRPDFLVIAECGRELVETCFKFTGREISGFPDFGLFPSLLRVYYDFEILVGDITVGLGTLAIILLDGTFFNTLDFGLILIPTSLLVFFRDLSG